MKRDQYQRHWETVQNRKRKSTEVEVAKYTIIAINRLAKEIGELAASLNQISQN